MAVDLLPQREGIYASFPTFVEHNGRIYIYYREGKRSVYQVHGLFGKVKRMLFDKKDFLKILHGENTLPPWEVADIKTVFSEENELDAIVSKIDDNLYSLCTRNCVMGKDNTCFVSFNNEPEFTERTPVKIKGLYLCAFYGKAFKSPYGYVFPAYGVLEKDGLQRPILLVTDTKHWDILAILPTMLNGNRLNECSVAYYKGKWHIFIREDDPPYGIWHSESENLIDWSRPKKLFSKAHAPMSVSYNGRLILGFRYLIDSYKKAVAYTYPFDESLIHIADVYYGNTFDGGYCDLLDIDGSLVMLYYWDNNMGSPTIKCRTLDAVIAVEKAA